MSELEMLIKIIKTLFQNFDQDLLSSKISPFLGLTYIKITPRKEHQFFSHHFYVFEPNTGDPQADSSLTLYNKSSNLFFSFITSSANSNGAYQDQIGYTNAVGINKTDVLVITLICDPEDYSFLYKSIINEIYIAVAKPQ